MMMDSEAEVPQKVARVDVDEREFVRAIAACELVRARVKYAGMRMNHSLIDFWLACVSLNLSQSSKQNLYL